MEALVLAQQREIERLRNLLDQSVYATNQGIVVRDRQLVTQTLKMFRPNDTYICRTEPNLVDHYYYCLSFIWEHMDAYGLTFARITAQWSIMDKGDCLITFYDQKVYCTHETFLIRLVEIENAIKEYFMRDERDFSKMLSVLDEFLMRARADWRKLQAK